MPDSFDLDLQTLIRICLNDPTAKADVDAALEAGPLPVRDACFIVHDGEQIYAARLITDRDREPGSAGFLARDGQGRFHGSLAQALGSDHHAATMTAEELARSLGVSPEQLDDHTRDPKV